jgi:hypothetical protein
VLEALEATAPAAFLRTSLYVYPLVNALHVFGIALLVGPILLADLRLLGRLQALSRAAVASVLLPTAALGFALAALSGAAMFTVQASDYALNPAFRAKLMLLALALANVAVLHGSAAVARFARTGEASAGLRTGALVSLVTWPLVLLAGRIVGYL